MKCPMEETRFNVADALERSEHPKAVDLLLKMQRDSYWFVRLRVAQGLSKIKSEDSLIPLRRMLKDENEHVRKAAQDSLNARGQN
jgi:HEAT repeat protein